jgi:hypothetical protein
MTLEECTIRLSQIDSEYQKAKREIEEKHERDRTATLNAWAKDNAKYHIGDIIEANSTAIVVERILGHRSVYGSNTYCIYQGHALTKRLQPRKDEWVATIHDDGGREIKLRRKAKTKTEE